MGYETRAFIVKSSEGMESTFTKYKGKWLMAFPEHGIEGEYYHYTETGEDGTSVEDPTKLITKKYCSVLASVDLGKLGYENDVPKKETHYFFFNDDGNSACIEDQYGSRLNQMTLMEAINFFQGQADYRRVKMLLNLMYTVKDEFGVDGIYVLFYGY
jgi:hypothetical protein